MDNERERKPDTDKVPDEQWVSDEDLEALRMERQLHASQSNREIAERIFEENLPVAASSIVKLSTNGTSERVRLEASKYVVERNLGKIADAGKAASGTSVKDPWEGLFDSVVRDADPNEVVRVGPPKKEESGVGNGNQ